MEKGLAFAAFWSPSPLGGRICDAKPPPQLPTNERTNKLRVECGGLVTLSHSREFIPSFAFVVSSLVLSIRDAYIKRRCSTVTFQKTCISLSYSLNPAISLSNTTLPTSTTYSHVPPNTLIKMPSFKQTLYTLIAATSVAQAANHDVTIGRLVCKSHSYVDSIFTPSFTIPLFRCTILFTLSSALS